MSADPNDQKRWTDTQRRIWAEEKAAALEEWVAWVASYPDSPFAIAARAVLSTWSTDEALHGTRTQT